MFENGVYITTETEQYPYKNSIMKEKCHNHRDRNALSFCHSCGQFFCAECLTEGKQYYFCKDKKCLEALCKETTDKLNNGEIYHLSWKERLRIGWYFSLRTIPLLLAILMATCVLFFFIASLLKNFDIAKVKIPTGAFRGAFLIIFLPPLMRLVRWISKTTTVKYFKTKTETSGLGLLIMNIVGISFLLGFLENLPLGLIFGSMTVIVLIYLNGYVIEKSVNRVIKEINISTTAFPSNREEILSSPSMRYQRSSTQKGTEGSVGKGVICHHCNGYGELITKTEGQKKSTICPHCCGTGWTLEGQPAESPPEELTPSPLSASRRKESMKMSTLQATQSILLIQWVIVPALGIWIWVKSGFFMAVLFIIIWLIVDKVWDWLTGLLIAGAGRIEEAKVSERDALARVTSGEVPGRMAFMMIVDLLGTFLIPWVVGGFFLGWFQ